MVGVELAHYYASWYVSLVNIMLHSTNYSQGISIRRRLYNAVTEAARGVYRILCDILGGECAGLDDDVISMEKGSV